ncbi:MAG: CDP-diacylglycerol--glycerol-3-phosphate 3-phosphatidyltransferase [Bdellovibrionaceae bacterium]|nr:CDP-diacylglycerol--glycerol-3-phosphate 3-phosphatidyltransferase [Pseudobdellovibrionaceae bacterium]
MMTPSTSPSISPSIAPWKKKLPMWLTWSRIAICPILAALLMIGTPVPRMIAAVLFVLASVTDWFDGSLARRYGAESNLGRFMDPIADKLLVATALILLVPSGHAHPLMVLLLLARDIFIGGIRSVAAADGVVIAAKAAGKWKTGMQMVGIPAILIDGDLVGESVGVSLLQLGQTLLWVSVFLSLISGIQYFRLYLQGRSSH